MEEYLIQSALYNNEWYLVTVVDDNFDLQRIHNVDLNTWQEVQVSVINALLGNAGLSSAKLAFVRKSEYDEWLQAQLDRADNYCCY